MSQRTSSIALIDLGPSAVSPSVVSPFRRVGRQTLLERTIRRLSESSLLDEIVIIGSGEHAGQIAQCATQPARWISSTARTTIERAWQAAEECQAEWVVCVGATSVFVDAILIDRLLASAWASPKSDMVAFMTQPHGELTVHGGGLAGDACNRRALIQLMRDRAVENDPRCLSKLLVSMPERFQSRLIPLPSILEHTDLRFELETEVDLDRALMILEATSEDCDYRDLVPLASHFERSA